MSAAAGAAVLAGWRVDMLENVPLLDVEQCARARDQVCALREHWTRRHPDLPFFTLGATNYYDIVGAPAGTYEARVRAINPILAQAFGWLYDALALALESRLGLPVHYPEQLALPGFHVFEAHEAFARPRALMHREWFGQRDQASTMSSPIHCDTAHLVVDRDSLGPINISRPVSITLALDLPAAGAGMWVWDLRLQQTAHLPETIVRGLLARRSPRLHAYERGAFALHSGLLYHQVAAMPAMEEGEMRLTLQGHGAPTRDALRVFW
ncbi:MAG: hypothetical protein H6983_24060 [Ectothiorhodospiraceae bacterium]|nr:hypothetical protein [Ectothiorhodospiraceae bacterium]